MALESLFAPSQAYILLAVAATVGSITAALVQTLFPRRKAAGAVVPAQAVTADRIVVKRRRRIVVGAGLLMIVSWSNVTIALLACASAWSVQHWLHFIGLLLLLAVFMQVILTLSDRLSATSTEFLETLTEGSSTHGGTSGPP